MPGVLTRLTVVGVKVESTEGTYAAPTSTNVLTIVEAPKIEEVKESIDRNRVKASFGMGKPLRGMRGANVTIPTEFRGAGTSGAESIKPENHDLLLNALGKWHKKNGTLSANSGCTSTVIKFQQSHGLSVGDPILFTLSGIPRFVATVDSATQVTLNSGLGITPATGVAIKAGHGYRSAIAQSDYGSLTFSAWLDAETSGPQFRGLGGRVEKLAITDFEVGKIPKLEASLKCLDGTWVTATTSPAGKSYRGQLPPVGLYGIIQKDGVAIAIEKLELTLENTVPEEKDLNAPSGKVRQYHTGRKITGKFDPRVEQGNIDLQNLLDQNTTFSIMAVLGIRNSSNVLQQGTVVGIYLPRVVLTKPGLDNKDGLMKHSYEFMAHEDETATGGGDNEIYIGIV